MKFWKVSLLTTLVFSAFVFVLFITACEKNVCDNVTCFNGGSCNVGTCHCPVGYEDPQCQTKSTARFLGVYAGLSTCDNGAYLIDTAWITEDQNKINYVYLTMKSILPRVLHGYVSSSESTYSIIVPDDSSVNYIKVYTATLQGDKTLTVNTFLHDKTTPGDTIISKCSFIGTK